MCLKNNTRAPAKSPDAARLALFCLAMLRPRRAVAAVGVASLESLVEALQPNRLAVKRGWLWIRFPQCESTFCENALRCGVILRGLSREA